MLQDLYQSFGRRIFILALVIAIVAASFLFWLFENKIEKLKSQVLKTEIKTKELPALFQGSLFLEPVQIAFSLKELEKNLKVSFVKLRPGNTDPQKQLQIGLKESKKKVFLGEKIFLAYEDGFQFCEKSPLFLIPFLESKTETENQAAAPDNKETKIGFKAGIEKEDQESIFKIFFLSTSSLVDKQPAGLGLNQAHYLGQDLLAVKYAQEEKLKRPRLEVEGGKILYLKEDAFYVFEKNKNEWREEKDLAKAKDKPLFKVEKVSPKELMAECWEGENRQVLTYQKTNTAALPKNVDQLFQDLRLRTQKQVTLKIDKQRLILRKGDVVFKKERWQLIRNPPIDQELLSSLQGIDFFIFEGVTEDKVFKGSFFNKDRTQVALIEKNLSKTGESKKRKRK